jgi:hypothetical protein
MNVISPLITNSQTPEAVEPGQRTLYHPSVATQPLFDTFSCQLCLDRFGLSPLGSAGDASLDPLAPQVVPTPLAVISFVSMQLVGSLARSASTPFDLDRLDTLKDRLKHHVVVDIGSGEPDGKGYAYSVDHNMALRARFALIRRVGSGRLAPLFAATVDESIEARDQSMVPASPSLSSSAWCTPCHTPPSCQSRRRRQHVIPLPQPISWGSISQGIPVLSTKMMPVSAARLDMRGRPPLGLGPNGSGGRSGSITSHSSSESSGFAIPHFTNLYWFC